MGMRDGLVRGPNPLYGDLRYKPYEEWDERTKARHEQAYERWRLLFQLGNITGLPFPAGYVEEDDPIWKLSRLATSGRVAA
jgi:hypothetical protein